MKKTTFAFLVLFLFVTSPVYAQTSEQSFWDRLQEIAHGFLGQVSSVKSIKPVTIGQSALINNDTEALLKSEENSSNLKTIPIEPKTTCGTTLLPPGIKGQTVKCDGTRWVANSFLRNLEFDTNNVVHIGDDWLPSIPVMLGAVSMKEFDGPDGPETATAIYGYSKNPFFAGAAIKGVSEEGRGVYGVGGLIGVHGLANNVNAMAIVASGAFDSFGIYQSTNRKNYFYGRVGIGVEEPKRRLHVAVDSNEESSALFTNNVTGHTATDGLLIGVNNNQLNSTIWNYENGYLRFGTNDKERMRITKDGDVGIGTLTPAAKLDVIGDVKISAPYLHDDPHPAVDVVGGIKFSAPDRFAPPPKCSEQIRGMLWFIPEDPGVKDFLGVCVRNAAGSYIWHPLF